MKYNNNKINVYEFININDLSLILNVDTTVIIKICLSLGIIVTVNYRLDKELILLICNELGYKVNFIDPNFININNDTKNKKKLIKRPPIVTIMGHVDHGKTSLLDYIRKTNTISKEYGSITQHIGIYNVKIKKNKSITFIDTPGHESFVSMRYRGLKITDIAIIVISSDSGVMKQTVECINNAKSDNIPIIFVFSKIDKNNSNVNKIKEQLSNLNILVKDWGGEYLSQEVSTKTGYGIEELIKKILIKSKELNLITNINTLSSGTIIESSLDKGKGYIVKLLVQKGILRLGDYIISGIYYGKIKSMYNGNNINIKKVYPSNPAIVIGFNGAPYSGEKFNVFNSEKVIKEISKKRKLLIREHNINIKTKYYNKRNNNNYKILNVIIKCDVDGSIDVISDEIQKLSKKKDIIINIIKKSVGNITKSDLLLAGASNAIIIGFNVKEIINKKKFYYNNKIEIYIFNLIYDIIDFLKKKITDNIDNNKIFIGKAKVIQIFKIQENKIFGCFVLEGKIYKKNKILIIRNNKIIYDGYIYSLKRFNKNVNEVKKGYDFGAIIKNYNDIKINDIIKCYK
ncbi:MAG: translation initiation factor IF-2 [Candidatus Shikimatogenerans bostrichidophilus]|nr:MAG: translation initiation factor IF-2 [Candidatus Shikimatogenerans bostrichidophilus]